MKYIIANLLIVIACLMLALAYRLKRDAKRPLTIRGRIRNEPSRWEVIKTGLQIAFSSVAFATVGV